MEKFYGMSNDYLFKAVMQEQDDVLRNLLCALLNLQEEDVVTCKIENPIRLGESVGDKECILDIKLLLNGNKNINVELQIKKDDDWPERSLLYWARSYDDIKAGESYRNLKPTYHIGIIDFPLYEGDDELYSEYRILDVENHRIYTEKFGIYVLNLSNVDNPKNADKQVVKWARIFKAKTLKELEEIAGEEEAFKKMVLEIRKLSKDEKVKQQMAARADYDSRMATARDAGKSEGIEIGMQQGIQQGKELGEDSIIMSALANGRSPESIAEFIDISIEKVMQVQAKMNK